MTGGMAARRDRRPQTGHTNRRSIDSASSLLSRSAGVTASTGSLRGRRKKGKLARPRLKPLQRPIATRRHVKKGTLARRASSSGDLLLQGTPPENVVIEALIDSVAKSLRQRYTGKRSLRNVFLAWDQNRDGVVDPAELAEIFQKCGTNITEKQAVEICCFFGNEKTKVIPYDGFIDLIFRDDEVADTEEIDIVEQLKSRLRQLGVPEEAIVRAAECHGNELPIEEIIARMKIKFQAKGSLQQAFRAIDDNKNGFVSVDELRTFLQRNGLETSAKTIQALFRRFDESSDGEVEYDEFISLVFPPEDIGAYVRLTPREREGEDMARDEPPTPEEETAGPDQTQGGVDTQDISEKLATGVRNAVIAARIRKHVAETLATKFNSILVAFDVMDDNGDGRISYGEFKNALKGLNLGLEETEVDLFLNHVDQDGSGYVDFDEFRANVGVHESADGLAFSENSAVMQGGGHWSGEASKPWDQPDAHRARSLAVKARAPDHKISSLKTATVANVGHAMSSRLPNATGARTAQIKRRLFPHQRAASALPRARTVKPDVAVGSAAPQPIQRSRSGQLLRAAEREAKARERPPFDFSQLHSTLSVPKRNKPKLQDSSGCIQLAPELLRPQTSAAPAAGLSWQPFEPTTRAAFNLSERAAYRNQPEQVAKRERERLRLVNVRAAQNRYKRETMPVYEDPDRRLKTVLKHRLNYYTRLDAQLKREQLRRPLW